jgi:hypothetical protein
MRTCKKNLTAFETFAALVSLLLLSIPLQAATVLLGDFEDSMDGWTPGSGITTAFSTQGVTQGASSLQVTFPSGWKSLLTKSMASQLSVLQTMTAVSMNVTTRNDGGQIPGWLGFLFIINSGSTGWQQFDLAYPGVPSSPRTDTLTVTIPQSIRDAFLNGTGGYADFILIANSGGGGIAWFDNIKATVPGAESVTIQVNAGSPIRTIPMTLYGANLQSWDGAQAGTNSTFNNLMKASGRKYLRIPGGSWGNGHLWSDIEGPNGTQGWKVSYSEYLNLLAALSQPGETIHPTLQPIVNFPGWWYETLQDDTPGDDDNQNYAVAHVNAVNAAVAWVQDQTARAVCAEYWEIGNEIGGPWEVGYFPEISGTFYGDYFADFYLGMKAVNPHIKIGACAEPKHELQPWGWYQGYWTFDTLQAAFLKGVVPDFLIIHQYPGSGEPASYNPILLADRVNDIAQYTSNLDGIIHNALGSQYVGQIRYAMTEWDAGGHDNYDRVTCYVNALFHAQYILEMAKYNWEVSNPWIPDYGSNYWVYPVWYVNPLLIHYFGRDMVDTTSSHSLIRAYAAKDDAGNLTVFLFNNSPTTDVTADIQIAGFSAGLNGQQWLIEPAGSMIAGGVNIQDKGDIRINGVIHPDPLTAAALPSESFSSGNTFALTLPASCMLLLKVPAATGDTTPPAAPTGLSAARSGLNVILDWNDNTEEDLAGYNVYRSTSSGSGYAKLNGTILVSSEYVDDTTADGQTYFYVARAVDTSWNESAASGEQAVVIPATALGTILREWWTGISGAAVSNLTSNPNYPNNPTGRQPITLLEGPVNWAENYGTRIRGYVYPPATGSYTFWIAGDDNCQLWLSTDGSPANKSQIAYISGSGWTDSREWNKFSSQQSSPRTLTAGQKYYIEVLHKEYTGGDNIAVAWEGPGIAQEVIGGRYLSPWFIGLYGDFDNSGSVTLDDLIELAGVWIQHDCAQTSRMDLNGDCLVDFYEFSQFAENWLNP